MHKPESTQENTTHKILCDFEIKTARRPDLVIINTKKRTFRIVDFAVPTDHCVRIKENEPRDKYLDRES